MQEGSVARAMSVDEEALRRLKATFGDDFFKALVRIFSKEMNGRVAVLEKASAVS
jgi:hypothetical protein